MVSQQTVAAITANDFRGKQIKKRRQEKKILGEKGTKMCTLSTNPQQQ